MNQKDQSLIITWFLTNYKSIFVGIISAILLFIHPIVTESLLIQLIDKTIGQDFNCEQSTDVDYLGEKIWNR